MLTVELAELCGGAMLARLDRDLATSNQVYLERDGAGRVEAFLVLTWDLTVVDGVEQATLYVGLGGTRRGPRGRTSPALMQRLRRDLLRWAEENPGATLLVWAGDAAAIRAAVGDSWASHHAAARVVALVDSGALRTAGGGESLVATEWPAAA